MEPVLFDGACAVASEDSQYRVAEISTHLTTNAWVVEQFGLTRVTVDEVEQVVVMPKAGEAVAPL